LKKDQPAEQKLHRTADVPEKADFLSTGLLAFTGPRRAANQYGLFNCQGGKLCLP
jgi:hypothetical protein